MTPKAKTEITFPTTLDYTTPANRDLFRVVGFELRELRAGAGGELAPDDRAISEERRLELLREVRQGEPHELLLDAIVSRQSMTPRPLPVARKREANKNLTVFHPDELDKFARGFKGQQFLRDHDRGHLEAVGGHIVSAELEEGDNWAVFRQTLHLVKPWAVEAALDGTLRTFSIGWDAKLPGWRGLKQSLFCTVCDLPILGSDCKHFPGDVVKLDGSGERVIVELQWRGVKAAETSGVSFPAVDHTSIADIRTALAAARSPMTKPHQEINKMPMLEKLRKELGLGADATAEEILEAQGRRVAELETELAASEAGRESAQATLEETRAAAKAKAAAERAAKITSLREAALDSGLITPGDKRDKLFGELAAISVDKAERFLATLEPAVPVGQPAQLDTPTTGADKPGDEERKVRRVLADEYGATPLEIDLQIKQMKQLGLSMADFLKGGQHAKWNEVS